MLRSNGDDVVLGRLLAGVAHAVRFAGREEGVGVGANYGRFALICYGDGAFFDEDQFFVLVMVRWMGLRSDGKRRLVCFERTARMGDAVQDGARLVLSVVLHRKLIERL